MDSVTRLLELVRRELGAEDARLELGGREPQSPAALFAVLPDGFRLVALFSEPPEDAADRKARLEALARAFVSETPLPRPSGAVPPSQALDEELAALVGRAEAVGAVVIDTRTPVLWGSADFTRGGHEDVAALARDAEGKARAEALGVDLVDLLTKPLAQGAVRLREAKVDREDAEALLGAMRRMTERSPHRDAEGWRKHFCTARAVVVAREATAPHIENSDRARCLVRPLSEPYLLVLAFDGPFSELHAEGAAIRVTPWIERLVHALPPVGPPDGTGPRGAKVLRIPRS